MNTKVTTITLLCAGITLHGVAGNRSYNEAVEIASQYVDVRESLIAATSRSANDMQQPYYIFNDKTRGHGFVIVSGRDDIAPVLGYSDKGSIDAASMPPALRLMLESSASVPASAGSRNSSSATPVVEPLVKTQWYQLAPYNSKLKSPNYFTCCVATAMAQVMNYHQWPEKGHGNISYESFEPSAGSGSEGAGLMQVNLNNSVYDWGNMLTTYADNNWNQTQADAVATLMRDCGYAAHAQYSMYESTAYDIDMAAAMSENFGYDAVVRPHFGDTATEEWLKGMKTEFDNGFPVIITGQSTIFGEGGHCFVGDGYDSNDFIHINWGWNGEADGYFDIGMFTPTHKGSESNHSFMQYYTSLHPRRPFRTASFNPSMMMLWDFENKKIDNSGLTIENTDKVITEENPASIRVDGLCFVANRGFEGKFELWLIDTEGSKVKTVCSQEVNRAPLSSDCNDQSIDIKHINLTYASLTDGVSDGKYSLIPMSIYKDMEPMKIQVYGYKSHLLVEINDGIVSVENVARPETKLELVKGLGLPSVMKLFTAAETEITLMNHGDYIVGGTVTISATPVDGGETTDLLSKPFCIYEHRSLSIPCRLEILPELLTPEQEYDIQLAFTDTDGNPLNLGAGCTAVARVVYDPEYKPVLNLTSMAITDEDGNVVDLANAVLDPMKLYTVYFTCQPICKGIAPHKVDIIYEFGNELGGKLIDASTQGSSNFNLDLMLVPQMPDEIYLSILYRDFMTAEEVLFQPESLSHIKIRNASSASLGDMTEDTLKIETARYDARGIRVQCPVSGLNIVVYSDGSVKKEFIKK